MQHESKDAPGVFEPSGADQVTDSLPVAEQLRDRLGVELMHCSQRRGATGSPGARLALATDPPRLP